MIEENLAKLAGRADQLPIGLSMTRHYATASKHLFEAQTHCFR
jgi:hypothetical protein